MKTVIYLDELLLTNFLAAAMLLLCTGLLCARQCGGLRLLAGSAAAAAFSLCILLPELGVRLVPCTTIAGHCVLPAVPAKALRVGSRRVQGFLAAFCRPEMPPEHWTALLDSELAGQLGIR